MCSSICDFRSSAFRQPFGKLYFTFLPSPMILLFACIVALPELQLLHKLISFQVEVAQKMHTSSTGNTPQLETDVQHMQGRLNSLKQKKPQM